MSGFSVCLVKITCQVDTDCMVLTSLFQSLCVVKMTLTGTRTSQLTFLSLPCMQSSGLGSQTRRLFRLHGCGTTRPAQWPPHPHIRCNASLQCPLSKDWVLGPYPSGPEMTSPWTGCSLRPVLHLAPTVRGTSCLSNIHCFKYLGFHRVNVLLIGVCIFSH